MITNSTEFRMEGFTGMEEFGSFNTYGYAMMYDFNGTCVAHGRYPEYVGTNIYSSNSTHATSNHRALMETANFGGGWVNVTDDDGVGIQFVYVIRIDAGGCVYGDTPGCYYIGVPVEDSQYIGALKEKEQSTQACTPDFTRPCAEEWMMGIAAAILSALMTGASNTLDVQAFISDSNSTDSWTYFVVSHDQVVTSSLPHLVGKTLDEFYYLTKMADLQPESISPGGAWEIQQLSLSPSSFMLEWMHLYHVSIPTSSIAAGSVDVDPSHYLNVIVAVPDTKPDGAAQPLAGAIGGSCTHVHCYRNGVLETGTSCAQIMGDGSETCECDGAHQAMWVLLNSTVNVCPSDCLPFTSSCIIQNKFQEDFEMQCHYVESNLVLILATAIPCTVVLALMLFFAWRIAMKRISSEKLLLRESRSPPTLSLRPEMRFHLFLSHVWRSGQDQVAVIKRALCDLLIEPSVFLDVDDLENIADLELYIEQSQVILIFLSKGYFLSKNCLREVRCALELNKKIVLVHESDFSKGGVDLETLRAECPRELVDSVFGAPDKPREIIEWRRVKEFQNVSLVRIAQALVRATPLFAPEKAWRHRTHNRQVELFLPNAITENLPLPRPATVLVSPMNGPVNGGYGAAAVAEMLVANIGALIQNGRVDPRKKQQGKAVMPKQVIKITDDVGLLNCVEESEAKVDVDVSTSFTRMSSHRPKASSLPRPIPREVRESGRPTHMLLYLNKNMFNGDTGMHLANHVRKAMESGMSMLLVHETVPERNGCEFDHFLFTTPEDLLDLGIYSTLASPLYSVEGEIEVGFVMLYRALTGSVDDDLLGETLRLVRTKSNVLSNRGSSPLAIKRKRRSTKGKYTEARRKVKAGVNVIMSASRLEHLAESRRMSTESLSLDVESQKADDEQCLLM